MLMHVYLIVPTARVVDVIGGVPARLHGNRKVQDWIQCDYYSQRCNPTNWLHYVRGGRVHVPAADNKTPQLLRIWIRFLAAVRCRE